MYGEGRIMDVMERRMTERSAEYEEEMYGQLLPPVFYTGHDRRRMPLSVLRETLSPPFGIGPSAERPVELRTPDHEHGISGEN